MDRWTWLSGFIDGEGCLGLYKQKTRSAQCGFCWVPTIQVGNTDKKTIELIAKIVGTGKIRTRKPVSGWKPLHEISWAGSKKVQMLLSRLVLVTKSEQQRLLLEACSLIHNGGEMDRTKDDLRLEKIWAQMRNLNKRGI